MLPRPRIAIVLAAALAVALLTGCGSSTSSTSSTPGERQRLHARQAADEDPGELTVATDKPAYPPYFENNDPTNGQGFESAIAYAIAKQLGYARAEVKWAVEPFNSSYAPGPKDFDFDVNEISITPAARQAGRLLGALLHGQPGGRRAEGLRRRQAPPRSPT